MYLLQGIPGKREARRRGIFVCVLQTNATVHALCSSNDVHGIPSNQTQSEIAVGVRGRTAAIGSEREQKSHTNWKLQNGLDFVCVCVMHVHYHTSVMFVYTRVHACVRECVWVCVSSYGR